MSKKIHKWRDPYYGRLRLVEAGDNYTDNFIVEKCSNDSMGGERWDVLTQTACSARSKPDDTMLLARLLVEVIAARDTEVAKLAAELAWERA